MMSSSPLRQGIWTVLAALLLAVPMYLLTRSSTAPQPAVMPNPSGSQAGEEDVECLLTIRCASLPEQLVIKYGGQVLFDLSKHESPGLRMEEFVAMPISRKRPIKLNVTARWPQGKDSSPITLTLEPDMLKSRSETRWSHGATLNDIYSFLW